LTINFGKNGNISGVNYNGTNYSVSDWNAQFRKLNPQWFGPLLLGLFYRRILTNRVHKNNFVPAQTTDGELYAERQVKGKHFRRLGCFSLFHSFLS